MKITRECIKQKGMHDIRRSLEVVEPERAKTHSSLLRIEEKTKPEMSEKLIELELQKERQRFLLQDQSLERSRKNVVRMRGRFLGKKVKNQRVMALRKALQAARYLGNTEASSPQPAPLPKRKYKTIRLTY